MPRNTGEIDEIDGLRGIAIFAVMVHRLWPRDAVNRFSVAADAGWIGVDLFFVVSGFLITRILLETRDEPGYFRNFYARRVLRIFPLYYLFVGTLLVVFPLAGNAAYFDHSGSPLWYLSFLGNIPEALLGKDPPYWLAPVWSLAIEEQFYLTFPWLVLWLGPQRLGRALLFLFLLAPAVRLATMLAWPDQERIQYLFTLCRVDAIAAGCSVALIMRWKGVAKYRDLAVLVACCAGAIAVITDLDRTTSFGRVAGYSFVAIGFAAALVAVLLGQGQLWTAPLRFSPLRYCGKLCFGLYLLHRPADTITTGIANRFNIDADRISWIPIKIVVAIAMASASWFLLEKPILKLKNRFASRKHPSAGVLAGAAIVFLVACHTPDTTTPGAQVDAGSGSSTLDGGVVMVDADPAIDASEMPDMMIDGSVEPVTPGHVVYAPGTRHSPITSDIVTRLQALSGGDLRVFAKLGDSITDTPSFATCFDGSAIDFGAHGALASTVVHFRQGNIAGATPFARDSIAAHGGWTVEDLLEGAPCALERELTIATPSYGVMLFGTNDNRTGRTLEAFALDLWAAVDQQLMSGTLPILSTLPPLHSYPQADARVPLFNLAVRAIAQGRQVLLVDLYKELSALPDDGISSDGIHPTVHPSGACVLTAAGLQYGYNVRNLITLEALARARAAKSGTAADATAAKREGDGTAAQPFRQSLPVTDIVDTRGASTTTACGASVTGVVYEVSASASIEVLAIGRATGIAVQSGSSCVQGSGRVVAPVTGGMARITISGAAGESMVIVR